MGTNAVGGNLEAYSKSEEVDIYEAKATKGLSPRERKVVDGYLDPGGSLLDIGCGSAERRSHSTRWSSTWWAST